MGTMIVQCDCGKKIRVRDRHAGRTARCPGCQKPIQIPVLDLGRIHPGADSSSEPPAWDNLGQVVMWIFLAMSILTAIVIAACIMLGLSGLGLFAAFVVMLFVAAMTIVRVYLAKSHALNNNEKSKNLLAGFGKMVLWEPTEGIVFLKNKQVQAVDNNPNDGGGIRIIFPILGEELGLRAPLTIQSTVFEDHNVFTLDYLPVSIRMTIWWRLADLERYFLSISKGVDTLSDSGSDDWESSRNRSSSSPSGQLRSAQNWITKMAESVGRQELAKTSTSFLVASQISSELPQNMQNRISDAAGSGEGVKSYQATANELGQRLESRVNSKIAEYGLSVDRVEIQEVRLPKEIHDAAVAACAVAFLPATAEREAAARKLQLQADAEVLGADAVALREVLGNAQGMSFLGVPDFLENLFGKLGQNRRMTEQSK